MVKVVWTDSALKPTPPILTTADISAITQTTATSGGNITSDGGETIISRGVCWNTSQNPTIADSTNQQTAAEQEYLQVQLSD